MMPFLFFSLTILKTKFTELTEYFFLTLFHDNDKEYLLLTD